MKVLETADLILVKEGRVENTWLFHSNCIISEFCFCHKFMISYTTLKIYDYRFS